MRFPRAFLVCLLVVAAAVSSAPPVTAGHAYVQPVWFTWDTLELDMVAPFIEDPVLGAAARDAVEAWQAGIAELGASWFAPAIEIRLYLPGLDALPPPGFEAQDIEVFIVPQGFAAVNPCALFCFTGQICVATAPVGVFSAYETFAHEIGHCLGLGHVFNHGVEYQPSFDLMGSGNVPTGRACPSNLNILVMERSFGALLGMPSDGEVTMAASAYHQSACGA